MDAFKNVRDEEISCLVHYIFEDCKVIVKLNSSCEIVYLFIFKMTHKALHIVKHNRIHELWNKIGSCAFSKKMNN
jgi:hypothetical protein